MSYVFDANIFILWHWYPPSPTKHLATALAGHMAEIPSQLCFSLYKCNEFHSNYSNFYHSTPPQKKNQDLPVSPDPLVGKLKPTCRAVATLRELDGKTVSFAHYPVWVIIRTQQQTMSQFNKLQQTNQYPKPSLAIQSDCFNLNCKEQYESQSWRLHFSKGLWWDTCPHTHVK